MHASVFLFCTRSFIADHRKQSALKVCFDVLHITNTCFVHWSQKSSCNFRGFFRRTGKMRGKDDFRQGRLPRVCREQRSSRIRRNLLGRMPRKVPRRDRVNEPNMGPVSFSRLDYLTFSTRSFRVLPFFCKSFHYKEGSQLCLLSHERFTRQESGLVPSSHFSYHEEVCLSEGTAETFP